MYGKIFDSMYDGTLAEDWRALITFQQLIVLCDADGVIDMTQSAISRRTGIPIEHIKAGIKLLESPDQYSRTDTEEGRRIMLIDEHKPWGWYIVNHSKYKVLQDSYTVRAQTRERVKKHRIKQGLSVTVGNGDVTVGNGQKRYTDTDTDTDKRKEGAEKSASQSKRKIFNPPTREQVSEYITEKGYAIDPDQFINHYEANGWMRGKNKIKDWKACLRTWGGRNKLPSPTENLGEVV